MRLKSAIVFAACGLSLGLAACEAAHTPAGPGGVGTPAVTSDPMIDQQRGRWHLASVVRHTDRNRTAATAAT
ncbi:hypothetical protein [Nocardia tengchongensis]|uniref:hypothetical protein n=2 Tax=Nocardia tengchongensis TaxID=2055889 RepID=UPI0036B023A2